MKFENFYKNKENYRIIESFDSICYQILESGQPVEIWFESVFIPVLSNGYFSNSYELLNEVKTELDPKQDKRYKYHLNLIKEKFLEYLHNLVNNLKKTSHKERNPSLYYMAEKLLSDLSKGVEKYQPQAVYQPKEDAYKKHSQGQRLYGAVAKRRWWHW